MLLKFVLNNTYIASQASMFTIKERFYDLNLKKYKWNMLMLNQDVREKLADLTAAGHSADKTDIIISLFQAYNTTTNEDFRGAITYWKNKWNSKVWTTPDELMQRADSKYMELKNMGTWGKRAAKDDQFVALTNKIDKLTKQKANKGNTSNSENKSAPKWKYDRSLSNGKTLE